MKSFRIFSYLTTLVVLVIAILGVTGVVDINSLLDVVMGHGAGHVYAIATAAATIEGVPVDTPTVKSASSDLLLDDISQAITIMRPDLYPLDTLLRRVGAADMVKSWTWHWYANDYRGWADTLASAFDTSASGTVVSTSAGDVHTVTVTNIHYWTVADTAMFPAYEDDDADGPLMALVIGKNTAAKTLALIVVNSVDMPDMPLGSKIVRMGPAKSELDAQTSQYGIMPQKTDNNVQIHMKQVEAGLYEQHHKKEVPWSMNDLKSAAMEDMRRGAEFTSWFGKKGYTYNTDEENYVHTSNGVIRYIENSYEYTETPADASVEFLQMTKSIFTGNAGSKTRYLFGGGDFMEWLAGVETVQKQRDAGSVHEMYGITFEKIQTNYGTLMVLYHQLFDDWKSENAVVLDLNNIYRKEYKKLALRKVDLVKSGQRLSDATVIEEIFGLETRYGLTHSILSPASSSST